ncbi:L-rhamnose-binding lectin CSL3-like [Labeo rohita]|uniref:L-rhamnose-binding lectin CSL3-like n=1 Tax=Labeo rohita TaxID=84645 RepID=UPI0021E24674|nr:L-rhamnose-binding lectin CSL3-like [Labeo rohita]
MLVQKRSWIISLLLLCQCGVEAEKIEICEGESADLNCDEGYIKIVQANYGRTDRTTCAAGKTENSISNTRCLQASSLSSMSAWCDGRKSCIVPATDSVFTDPCDGTYKYLSVSYECIPARKKVTCDNTQSNITCGTGVISVHYANYGRRDLVTCPGKLVTTRYCYSPQTSSLRSRCNGKKSCELNASNSIYSDPCYGVQKYLEVTYSCE